MKKQHRFRITDEHMQAVGEGDQLQEQLILETGYHDNIADMARRAAACGSYSANYAAAPMVGLKLVGELVHTHKVDVLLQRMKAPIGKSRGQLKFWSRAADESCNAMEA